MIKIIKTQNQKLYKTTCKICNCSFNYEAEDIKFKNDSVWQGNFIECPSCNCNIRHYMANEIKEAV